MYICIGTHRINTSLIRDYNLDITKSNNDELINKTKEDLLVIDQNNNTTKQIIQDSLIYLSKLNLSNNFTRRRYHA
jgi:hypothetical protein